MDFASANFLDIVVVLVLLVSGILAYFRGFVHETLSVGGWVGAFLATIYGFPFIQPHARSLIESQLFADIGGGLLLFIISLFLLSLLTAALSSRIRSSALGAIDRALGFFFGLARGGVIACIGFIGLVWFWSEPDERPEWLVSARSTPLLATGSEMLKSLVPPEAGREAGQTVDEFTRETQKMLETQKTLRDMLEVKPKSENDKPPAEEPAYGRGERRDMERVVEGIR